MSVPPILFDPHTGIVSCASRSTCLPVVQSAVFAVVARERGRLVPAGTIRRAVWGRRHAAENVVRAIITGIRCRFYIARIPECLMTAYGRGYYVTERVVVGGAPDPVLRDVPDAALLAELRARQVAGAA